MATGFDSSSARWATVHMDPKTEHAAALATVEFLNDVEKAAIALSKKELPDALCEELVRPFESFNSEHLDFLIATLGTGEVRIAIDNGAIKIEETQITGLWRVEEDGKQKFILASIPETVMKHLQSGKDHLEIPASTPEGVFAAPSILQELAASLSECDMNTLDFDPPHMVELTRQPLEKADMLWLNSLLGTGSVEIWLSGFANAHIRSTSYRGIWRSTLLNRAGKGLLDSFLVALLPPEVPASPDEFLDTAQQTREIITWLKDDIDRGTL